MLLVTFDGGDGVLVQISGHGDALGDLGGRRRSLEDGVVLGTFRLLFAGSCC